MRVTRLPRTRSCRNRLEASASFRTSGRGSLRSGGVDVAQPDATHSGMMTVSPFRPVSVSDAGGGSRHGGRTSVIAVVNAEPSVSVTPTANARGTWSSLLMQRSLSGTSAQLAAHWRCAALRVSGIPVKAAENHCRVLLSLMTCAVPYGPRNELTNTGFGQPQSQASCAFPRFWVFT